MADMNKLLIQLLGSGAAGGFAGGLAGGLAGNLLTSKSGRKMGKMALKMGGIAAVGCPCLHKVRLKIGWPGWSLI